MVLIIKKIAIGLAGGLLLAIGLAMVVLPGPAIVVIPAGLAVLAVEYPWARRWLEALQERIKSTMRKKTGRS